MSLLGSLSVYRVLTYLIYSVLSLHGEFLHSRRQHSDSYYSSLLWVDVHMLQFTVLQLILGSYFSIYKRRCWRKWFPLACRHWTHLLNTLLTACWSFPSDNEYTTSWILFLHTSFGVHIISTHFYPLICPTIKIAQVQIWLLKRPQSPAYYSVTKMPVNNIRFFFVWKMVSKCNILVWMCLVNLK